MGSSRGSVSWGGLHHRFAALMNMMIGVSRHSQHVGLESFSRYLSNKQVSIEEFIFYTDEYESKR